MSIDMATKRKYITMFEGYEPKKRFCKVVDNVSRTIQDAIVDIPSLLKAFNGRLDDLFDRYNNGLVFESVSGTGVFLDELNSDEVARYNKFLQDKADSDAKAAKEAELFEQFKSEVARKVEESRLKASISPSEATE